MKDFILSLNSHITPLTMIVFLMLTENSGNYIMNLQDFTHHLFYLETIQWGVES